MSEQKRYERYKAWCELLGVPAAPFAAWRHESAKIPELHFQGITYRVQQELGSSAQLIPEMQ